MSYNNIGLSTPRGSGTSGHIQANRSALRQRDRPRDSAAPDLHRQSFASRAPDKDILEHERKRAVEAKCFELQVSLEDDGVEADEIESQVAALRQRLLAQQQSSSTTGAIKPHERHQIAQAKQQADERMRNALGIKQDTFVEGAAFDRELQQRLKLERQAEREKAREERLKIELELKADRARVQAARDEQRQKHEREMDRERQRQRDELDQSRRDHAARMRSINPASDRLPYSGGGEGKHEERGRSLSRSPPPRDDGANDPRNRRPLRRYSSDDSRRSPSGSRSRSRSPERRGGPSGGGLRSGGGRSRSPSPYRRRPSSRSRSPPPRRRQRRDSPSRSRSRSLSRSRSPPPAARCRGAGSRSRSPARRSGSPPSRRRRNSLSPSPPPPRRGGGGGGGRGRSRSMSMSMSPSPSPPPPAAAGAGRH